MGQPLTTKRYSDLAGTQGVADSNLTYDALSRPTNMTHSKGGVNTAFYNYAYDASRITNVSNKDGTSAYTYDDVDQLTGANYSFQPSESYTYDLNGNRTNAGYQTGLNNRLLSDGTFNYEYDNEGNRTRRTDIITGAVTEYAWDYRNRLIQATEKTSSGTVVNQSNETYDPTDLRIGKTANGVTERYVYGQNQNIALEFDGSGAQTHRYLHGSSIDQVLADEASGAVGWTLSDNLGTVRDVVNTAGSSQNHITYNSFDNVTSESNPSFDTRFTFTGRELDAETGNYDYRNRQYNPRSGRFIEEDPIGFAGRDANLYRYVFNAPTNSNDPLGLEGKVLFFEREIRYSPMPNALQMTVQQALGINPIVTEHNINNVGDFFTASVRVAYDHVSAVIVYADDPGGKNYSLHSSYNGLYPNDQRGHIVPHILGGSEKNGSIQPFENNFFSQNAGVNMGKYGTFNRAISQSLNKFTNKNINSNLDPCVPRYAQRNRKYLTYDVILKYDYTNRNPKYQNYPLRPDSFTAIAKFFDTTTGEDVSRRRIESFDNP